MEISSLISFPGLTIYITFALFHILGKQAVLRHQLYKAVVDFGNKLKARWRMSLVIPSSPGALFLFIPFKVPLISAGVNTVVYSLLFSLGF